MSDSEKPTLFRPAVGKRGMTALHYAAYRGDLPALEQQLREGADVNLKDEYRGYTALHWVADMAAVGDHRLEMLKLLVTYGARIEMPADNGATALSLANESGTAAGELLAAELLRLGAKV